MQTRSLQCEDRNRLLIAGLASAALHAAVLAASVLTLSSPRSGLQSSDLPPPPPDQIVLGIDRSRIVTVTWLGFEDPTQHEAQRSQVEQAALAMREQSRPVEHQPPPDPTSLDSPSHTQIDLAEPEERPLLSGEAAPATANPDATIQIPADRAAERVTDAVRTVERLAAIAERLTQEMVQQATAQQPATEAAHEPTAEPVHEPSPPSPSEPSPLQGQPSDRESPAASLREPIRVVPGRPAAAEGLEIQTRVPPSFTIPTRLTAGGLSPIYEVSFDHEGIARRVEIIRRTGNPDVDEPGRNAIYQWRARGEALAALPRGEDLERLAPTDPRRWVTIRVQLIRGAP